MFAPRHALVAVAAPVALLLGAGSQALAAPPKAPSTPRVDASPRHLAAAAGSVKVTAFVRRASRCTLRSNRPLRGLPHTVRCRSGRAAFRLRLPANHGSEPVSYGLSLTATGRGSRTSKVQVYVAPSGTFSLSVGGEFSCARVPDGRVECWGSDVQGQLGDGAFGEAAVTSPVTAGASRALRALTVTAGEEHACALLAIGEVDCWGKDEAGELGTGAVGNPPREPVRAKAVSEATGLAVGGEFTCASALTGVSCWGADLNGELGDGASATRALTPQAVVELGATAQLSAGHAFACALEPGGAIACWGEDLYGQLGDGASEEPSVTRPMLVKGLEGAREVAAGTAFACARLASGSVSCWGEDKYGQLGDGRPGRAHQISSTPVAVSGLTGATEIAAGEKDACALLAGGAVDCWGAGELGQLGPGRATAADVPTRVQGVGVATQIAAGGNTICALLSDEQVECWGSNGSGQVGDGRVSESPARPSVVAGLP